MRAALIEAVKEGVQVGAGDGPVKRNGGLGVVGLEAEDALAELVGAGEVAGRRYDNYSFNRRERISVSPY